MRRIWDSPIDWRSAYEGDSWNEPTFNEHVIVLEGLEEWMIAFVAKKKDFKEIRESWRAYLESLLAWESEDCDRRIIIIGTDITKGIVPLEKENRTWRDAVGWAYQDLAALAERVDVIWYGLNQRLK